jgi:hypothetical protein
MVEGIRSHVDHSAYAGEGGGSEQRAKNDFNTLMAQQFGKKYESLLEGFAKHLEGSNTKVSHIDDRAGPEDKGAKRSKIQESDNDGMSGREVDGELPIDEMTSSKLTEGDLADQYDEPTFHGNGADNTMIMTKGAHNRNFGATESASERVLNTYKKKYGGHKNVEFVGFKDLPKDIQAQHMKRLEDTFNERWDAGDDEAAARKYAYDKHGRPNDVGMIRMEGMKQEGRLSTKDMEQVVVIDSKSGAGDKVVRNEWGEIVDKEARNPSAIRTGAGAIIDARRLIRFFQPEFRTSYTESDDKSTQHRLARVFMEGIAAVQDHLGKRFEVPDGTVLQVRDFGLPTERSTTWGELKKLSHAVVGKEKSGRVQREYTPEEISAQSKAIKARIEWEVERLADAGRDPLSVAEIAEFKRELTDKNYGLEGANELDLTETLRDASRNELLRMKKDPEKIVSAYDLATDAEFARRNKRGDKLSKKDAAAIFKAFETPEVKEANSLLFRIEAEIEGRSDNSLVSKVDSSEKSLQARRIDAINKRVDAVKAARADEGKPMTPIEVAKYTKDLMDGKSRFSGVERGEVWSDRDEHMANLDAYNTGEANSLNEKNIDFATRTLKSDGRIYRDSKDSHGMQQDIGPDAQPHIARRNAGVFKEEAFTGKGDPSPLSAKEQAMVNRTSMDGSKVEHTGRAEKYDVSEYGKDVDKFVSKLSRSVVTAYKEMAKQIKDLYAIGGMSKLDNSKLGALIAGAKKPEDVAKKVAELTKKYMDRDEIPWIGEDGSQFGGSELKKTRAFGEPVAEGKMESRQMPGKTALTRAQRTEVREMIKGKLGQQALVVFGKLFHAGDYQRVTNKAGLAHDLIRLSKFSLDPMSTGFHETLHGFIQHMREMDKHGVNAALYKAADSLYVRGKLREFLKNEPDALKQIDGPNSSTEERAAYMYQMWASDKLSLHDAPRNILQKISDFIKKTLKIWTSNERAENIMQYLHDGEYARSGLGDRSAVQRALLDAGTNKTFEGIKQTLEPLARVSHNIISPGNRVIERMHNASFDKISKLLSTNTNDEGKGTGWISAARQAKAREMNNLMTSMNQMNITPELAREALEQLQSGKPAKSPEARLLAREGGPIRAMLDNLHDYATASGVDLGDRGKGSGYFPVIWDISHIAANQKTFRTMLEKYVRSGDITSADSVIKTLLSNDGNDIGIETNRPGMQASKKRKLDFISKEDRAEFLQKDLYMTMNSYVSQITRRAEWASRLGDDSAVLNRLMAEAKHKHGATDAQMATMDKFVKGVDGTLGDAIDPGMRRLFGNAIVYQNIRLLPFAVFSMAVDPGGIMVRGGTLGDAFTAFKRGITEIKRGFDKNPSKDEWYQMAETMGVIDNATLVHTLGTGYSQGMVGDTGRKINDWFFRANLVEQMNTSMRVAAIPAAMGFMKKLANTNNFHNARWLTELDLTKSDIIEKNGKLLTTQAEFEAHGMNPAEALASENRMRLAVNKWVDGAVLRPNAAQKPGWMNDPHFALVAHLKQFVYSFNETIIRRVMNEAKYGNYTPAYAVAGYIPTMMAADFIKGMIVGGGEQPDYKDGWTLADYIGSGVQRSGLLMTGQFGFDAYKDLKMGGTGVEALLGPQIEQLADGIKTLGGNESAGSFALDAAPISPIVKALSRAGIEKSDPITNE